MIHVKLTLETLILLWDQCFYSVVLKLMSCCAHAVFSYKLVLVSFLGKDSSRCGALLYCFGILFLALMIRLNSVLIILHLHLHLQSCLLCTWCWSRLLACISRCWGLFPAFLFSTCGKSCCSDLLVELAVDWFDTSRSVLYLPVYVHIFRPRLRILQTGFWLYRMLLNPFVSLCYSH